MAVYYKEGTYTASILSHTFAPGKFGVQLVIEIEPFVDGNIYKRTVFLPFLDEQGNPAKYADKTIEVLQSIGYYDDPSRLDNQSANPISLVGTEITAYCKHTGGKERWYINTPREQVEREVVDKNTLRKLDALFGRQLKKPKAATAKPALAPVQTVEEVNAELAFEPELNDDVPF